MKAKKIVAIVAVSLVSLVALVAGGATVQYDHMFAEQFVVAPHQVATTTSPEDLAEGQRLLKARGCADCHGSDFADKHFLDDPGLGKLASSNITGGKGSAVGNYSDLDLKRIIRHAVRPTGLPLFFMPAHEYWFLSDVELGRIIQALRQVPKVDRDPPPYEPTLLLQYQEAEFLTVMRTGKRPDGTDINPFMPWKVYSHMTDTELKALYAYLMSLPAREFGGC